MLRSPVPHLVQELTQPDQTGSPQEERVGGCPLLHLSSWKVSMFEEDRAERTKASMGLTFMIQGGLILDQTWLLPVMAETCDLCVGVPVGCSTWMLLADPLSPA